MADVRTLFARALELRFEDGMESSFSRDLVELIRTEGSNALEAIANLIADEATNTEVAGEALRWLGYMDDAATRRDRLGLLLDSLLSPHMRVRDGALLGIAAIDDPAALPALRDALVREASPSLREDIEQVIEQLAGDACYRRGLAQRQRGNESAPAEGTGAHSRSIPEEVCE